MTNTLSGAMQDSLNIGVIATSITTMRISSTIDTPTMASAAQDALAVPEILENILSNLSTLELNRAKRVSRIWDFVIADWASLGFVKADYSGRHRMLHIYRFGGCFWQHSSFSPPRMAELHLLRSYVVARVVRVHPYLTPRCIAKQLSVSQMEVDFPNLHKLFALPEGGSWENVFLTQPPIQRMTIEIHGKILGPASRFDIIYDSGLQLGMIVRALRMKVGEIPAPKSNSKAALRLTKQIRVIGLVARRVSAESSLVSEAEMFKAEDGKVQSKDERRRQRS